MFLAASSASADLLSPWTQKQDNAPGKHTRSRHPASPVANPGPEIPGKPAAYRCGSPDPTIPIPTSATGAPVMVAPGWAIREPATIYTRLPFWHWTSRQVQFADITNITGMIPGTGMRCLPPYSSTSNATGGKSQGSSIPLEMATCGFLSVKTTASVSSTPVPMSDKMYSLI